jgi:hypothetical protein
VHQEQSQHAEEVTVDAQSAEPEEEIGQVIFSEKVNL